MLPSYLREDEDFRVLPGTEWVERVGKMQGRQGVVIGDNGTYIDLDPRPGSCVCKAKQRRTRIRRDRFFKTWKFVKGAAI